MKKQRYCSCCKELLGKDLIALNRKLLGENAEKSMCLRCLSDYLACTEDDLIVKIEEFKENGCVLFL
jgi:hypothetical protein